MERATSDIILRYGLLTGLCVSFYILLEFLWGLRTTHIEWSSSSLLFVSLIPLLTLTAAIRDYQRRSRTRVRTFDQEFWLGASISALAAAIIALFLAVYQRTVNPEFLRGGLAAQQGRLFAGGEMEGPLRIPLWEQWMLSLHPLLQSFFIFTATLLFGCILSVMISVAFRIQRRFS